MSVYSPLFAATLLAAVVGTAPAPSQAQPASDQQPRMEQRVHADRATRPTPGRFIEGRLAFLRTELKLTDAQQPLFDKLADEMRATAKEMEARHAARRDKAKAEPASAVEKMERRNAAMKQASAASDRFLAAFKPFYASLSEEQQKTADQLFGRQNRHHHHGLRHH